MAGRGGKARRKSENSVDEKMASVIDAIVQYEDFKETVLPELRRMVAEGKSAQEMFEWAEGLAAAKMITAALTDTDSGRAITATKDILDRSIGKAKERTEVQHKFAKLSDEELDAIVASEMQDLEESEDERLQ